MNQKMTMKEWLPLIGITFSAFIFNTSEFMPIALLTDIGHAFNISEALAGSLISVYALFVMVLSLPLMILVSKIEYRKLLLSTTFVFALAQFLSAISSNFMMLMLSRLLVACTHAIFWSIASPLGVRIVRDEFKSKAMSTIVCGSSVAMIFGMPLGRVIGLHLGWRMTFGCVGIVASLILIYLSFVFPRVEQGEGFTLNQLPDLFKNKGLVSLYVLTLLFASAYYTGYSYIDPFLQQVAHLSDNLITTTLMIFGGSGLIGSFLFSKYYDRNRLGFTSKILIIFTLVLCSLTFMSKFTLAIMFVCGIWGMMATACNVTFQAEVIRLSNENTSAIAMSIFSGIFNLGISCGTFIGGQVTTYASIKFIGYVGFIIGMIAVAYLQKSVKKYLI